METSLQQIGLIVLPEFQVMCFAALSVFEVANKEAGRQIYELHVLSERGGPILTSFGMTISTEPLDRFDFDTLLIGVGMDIPKTPPGVIEYLRKATNTTRRIASICLGSFCLGDAGLLNGRRATTHWLYAQSFQKRYPKARVDVDRIFIEDRKIWTSAGMSAGTDLALGLVESDHGRELAKKCAKGLVIHHRRGGGQSQHSALLELDASTDRIQAALAYAKRNLSHSLKIEDLSKVACLSPRQFGRVFRTETGVSPAKAIELLRLEAAKLLLEQSKMPIETIAVRTGFGDRERMRRAFLRTFGEPPKSMRDNKRG
jgi:transcriptional regulator GlxA family with amidase domain